MSDNYDIFFSSIGINRYHSLQIYVDFPFDYKVLNYQIETHPHIDPDLKRIDLPSAGLKPRLQTSIGTVRCQYFLKRYSILHVETINVDVCLGA